MSRQAQATREKQARVILGEAEVEIAALFDKAAETYRGNPTALHLRAMNMLYVCRRSLTAVLPTRGRASRASVPGALAAMLPARPRRIGGW